MTEPRQKALLPEPEAAPSSRLPRGSRRSLVRACALLPAAAVLLLAGPAGAAVPDQWDDVPDVSALDFLMVLVIIPGGLFLVIALLSSIGGMARSSASYQPGLAWRHEPEWFGGPRGGLEKVDRQPPVEPQEASERGGASGRW